MRFVAALVRTAGWDRRAFLTEARAKNMPGSLTRPMHNSSDPLCNLEISKDMDLKRLRTFVAVAELGTGLRAARWACALASLPFHDKSATSSRSLASGFLTVGRRLMLTAIGEQLLGDCRDVLGHVGSLGERVDCFGAETGGC